ncbi:MAG: queuosine precursor transporter [Terriglobales bacterium]
MTNTFVSRLTTKPHSLRDFRYYDICVHVFVVILLISNLVASKIIMVGPFKISGALLLFPLTYIFGDIFTEVYGYSGSRRAIWIGFFASTLLAVLAKIIVVLPPAPEFLHQEAYTVVFDQLPRAIIGSLAAFWAGEFTNSYVLAKMKVWTGGKYLWTRTVGSTVVGQAVDTTIVITIIFAGTTGWMTIGNLILSGYLAKVVYEAVMTPFTYLVVNALKRAEGIDVYDVATDFNPFAKAKAEEVATPQDL